jgi:WD40 repeat protein
LVAGVGSSGDKHVARVWRLDSGELQRTIQVESSGKDIKFCPDGSTFAIAGYGDTVSVYDAQTGELKQKVEVRGSSNTIAFSPDGQSLAVGNYAGEVAVWGLKSRKATWSVKGHKDYVSEVAFHPDARYVASSSADNTVKVWTATTGDLIKDLPGPGSMDSCEGVAFSRDGARLAGGFYEAQGVRRLCLHGETLVWNVKTWTVVGTFRDDYGGPMTVGFSPDGAMLATGSQRVQAYGPGPLELSFSGEVRLWTCSDGKLASKVSGGAPVFCVVFSSSGKNLAARVRDGITIWDLAGNTVQ